MKRRNLLLVVLTVFFIICGYFYYQYNQYVNFEFPEVSFRLNEQFLPYTNLNYEYHRIGMTKKMTGDLIESEIPTVQLNEIKELTLIPLIDEQPSNLTYVIKYEGSVIYNDSTVPDLSSLIFCSDEAQIKEGLYSILVTWDYDKNDGFGFNGEGSTALNLVVNLPLVAVVEETQVNPGEFIKVSSRFGEATEKIEVRTNLTSKEITTYEIDGHYETFIPIDYRIQPGEYVIDINYFQNDHLIRTEKTPVVVSEKEFPTQHLIMPESTVSSTMTAESTAEYNTLLFATRALKTPTRYFEDTFVAPTTGGIITTDFALTRYTNDNPTPTKHAAIDIALETGSPVTAVASGKAVVARFLQLTGNTIMIDHGYGLISYYYHLDELKIDEGSMVTQNDLIGTVGTTGYSTGPHLHFAVSLNEIYLNPWFLFPFDGYVMDED